MGAQAFEVKIVHALIFVSLGDLLCKLAFGKRFRCFLLGFCTFYLSTALRLGKFYIVWHYVRNRLWWILRRQNLIGK